MTEPWFDPIRYSWIPGTCLGVVAGLLGAAAGMLAPRGKARPAVVGGFLAVIAASATALVAALAALAQGQPYGVWYGLALPGLMGILVPGLLLPQVIKVYRQAEERRLAAGDLR